MFVSSKVWKYSIAIFTIAITTSSLSGCQPKISTPNCSSPQNTLTAGSPSSPNPQSLGQTTVWNSVAIAGMGFVTGLVIHPKERDLIYIRTDV